MVPQPQKQFFAYGTFVYSLTNSSTIIGSNKQLNHYREQYTAQPLQGAIHSSTITGSNKQLNH